MFENMQNVYLAIPLSCLAGAIVAGLFGKLIGRAGAHTAAILGVAVAFGLSLVVFNDTVLKGHVFNGTVYAWGVSGGIPMEVGFLIVAQVDVGVSEDNPGAIGFYERLEFA